MRYPIAQSTCGVPSPQINSNEKILISKEALKFLPFIKIPPNEKAISDHPPPPNPTPHKKIKRTKTKIINQINNENKLNYKYSPFNEMVEGKEKKERKR